MTRITSKMIDVRRERGDTYHVHATADNGHYIRKYGDYRSELVHKYVGGELGSLTDELIKRVPENSTITVDVDGTTVATKDKQILGIPLGVDDPADLLACLDKCLKPATDSGPLDLRGAGE